MSLDKKDFYGKEVTDAIKKACEDLGVAQEQLEIEVVETGSTGIFGLIRKKAHIKVLVKDDTDEEAEEFFEAGEFITSTDHKTQKDALEESIGKSDLVADIPEDGFQKETEAEKQDREVPAEGSIESVERVEKAEEVEESVSPESLKIIETELLKIVDLMGFPSSLEIESDGLSVSCTLKGEFEENLAGPDGKVLDSLQYILRKVVTRKVPERLRLSLNVGDFRQRRLEELKVKAVELAALVKSDGKTQALPALNPSERRAIHMVLQEDKEIRSRSVGDGLFKKILIYKPGKGNRGGRKRSGSKGRQNRGAQNHKQKKDT